MGTGGTRTGSDPGGSRGFFEGFLLPPNPPRRFGIPQSCARCLIPRCFPWKFIPGQGEGLQVSKGSGCTESRGRGGECPEEGEGEEGAWLGVAPGGSTPREWFQGDPGPPGVVLTSGFTSRHSRCPWRSCWQRRKQKRRQKPRWGQEREPFLCAGGVDVWGDPRREQGGLGNVGMQREPRRKQGVPGDTERDRGMEQRGLGDFGGDGAHGGDVEAQ